MDVGEWLRGLGLGEYEDKFRDNRIDAEILPQLTLDDLKDIGVSAVGDRRKLIAAIAALAGTTSPADVPASPSKSAAVIGSHLSVERRQLTVMFSDLVGSTALSGRLDPEDMRAIVGSYHKAVAKSVQDHDGFVAKYMGDGVLAYFGYPRAHEDDAERAVQAGLAIIEAAPRLENGAGETLHVRVGIATGIVVVGDLVGSGESTERGVVGDTPNLAARLQAIAIPDSVVVAETTRKLVGDLFELHDLGARDLKGIAGPTRAFEVLRSRSIESRFDAMHGGALTPLVGRDEEIDLLLRRWALAKAAEGQVVFLSGEAGIGKSRLTAALMERITSEPLVRLRYFCSPQRADSALYPISNQLERAARFSREDDPKTKLDKLDALLAQTETSRVDAGLLVEMLGLANDGRYPSPELPPQRRRHDTLTALVRQIEALSRKSPTLMVFEDAHWSDPSSLETIARLIDQIERLRVLLIVTHRPEFAPSWIGRRQVTTLTVSRLKRREIDLMIASIVGNKAMPQALRSDIAERADGVPLFAEEIAKAALEAADVREVAHAIAAIPPATQAVPATLHASLLARLDRLGEAKEIAQIGAVIGREFGYDLLRAVANKNEIELAIALDRLVQAGLVFRQGAPPHATYLFKHALVQDTAYGTLLREQRRTLHARIAEALESVFSEVVKQQPELPARHCTEAGLIEKAAAFWGSAGKRSLERSALVEAIALLTRALDQMASLQATPVLRREQIQLQVALITPLAHVKGYAASETKAAVERARLLIERAEALGESPEDPLLLFSVLYGFWITNYIAFNGDVIRELATQFLALAEKQPATMPLIVGHRLTAISLLCTGDMSQGRAHLDRALALNDPAAHRPLAIRFGQDASVSILSYRGLALFFLGYPQAALSDAERLLKHAREIGQAATLMFGLAHAFTIHFLCGEYSAANKEIRELLALADEKGALFWKVSATCGLGNYLTATGNASDAVQAFADGVAAYRPTGSTMWLPFYLSHFARAHAELGQFTDAWRCIDEAMTAVEATKEQWFEADILRIAGEIALKQRVPDASKAEEYFERALAVARKQHAKSWELRAAISMARLWRDRGHGTKARDLLAPVFGWFTEGFETRDLREAKVLLEGLT